MKNNLASVITALLLCTEARTVTNTHHREVDDGDGNDSGRSGRWRERAANAGTGRAAGGGCWVADRDLSRGNSRANWNGAAAAARCRRSSVDDEITGDPGVDRLWALLGSAGVLETARYDPDRYPGASANRTYTGEAAGAVAGGVCFGSGRLRVGSWSWKLGVEGFFVARSGLVAPLGVLGWPRWILPHRKYEVW